MKKSLEEYRLFIKGVSETIKNVAKNEKGRLLRVLLGTFGTSKLLGNLLTGKGKSSAGENIIGGGQNFCGCHIEPKFNGVNSN